MSLLIQSGVYSVAFLPSLRLRVQGQSGSQEFRSACVRQTPTRSFVLMVSYLLRDFSRKELFAFADEGLEP